MIARTSEGYIEGSIVRTARKEHRCSRGAKCLEARRPIRAGERYVEYVGEVALYQSGYRYHIACAEEELK